MRKSNNLKIALLTAVLSVIGLTSIVAFLTQNDEAPEELAVGGGPGTINQISPLIVTGGYVKVASSTAGFQVPSLANCDTIDTDGDGKFECGTDGGGAGGSATTTINGVSGPDFTFASGTATGIGLIISTSTGTLTFTPTVSSGYVIPLSASTTEWHNKVSSQWGTSGSNIYYSAGNVGIGTTTPTERLAVTGEGSGVVLMGETGFGSGYSGLSFNGGLGVTTYNLLGGVTQNHLWINRKTGGDIYFRENNVDQVVIKGTTGNVGIGTASPSASAKLHIDGSNALIYTEPSADDGQWNGLNTLNSSGAVIGGFTANTQSGEVAVGSRNASYFTTIYGGSAERMRITSAGNVGIGTSTPVSRLAIQTTGTTDILNLFETGGTEVLTVLESGNVGIGTTTPSHLFTVAGDTNQTGALRFAGNAGTTGQVLVSNGSSAPAWTATSSLGLAAGFFAQGGNSFGTTATLGTNDSQNLAFETNGTTRMTIASTTGNVGIGTASPGAQLTVVAGADTDIIDFRESGGAFGRIGAISAADLQSRIYVGYGSGTEHLVIRYNGNVGIGTTTPAARLSLQTTGTTDILNLFETGGTEVFTVLENGNVGIGTTSPTLTSGFGLHIKGVTAAGLRLEGGTGAGGYELATVGGAHNFGLYDVTNAAYRLYVLNNGNVGIGDTAPNQLLGLLGTNAQASIEESDTEFLRVGVGETAETSVIGWDDADALHLGLYSSPTDTTLDSKMVITSAGNVGIGSSTPSSLLTVQGNAWIGGNITATGTLAVTGSTTISSLATANCDVFATALGSLYCGTNGAGGGTVTSVDMSVPTGLSISGNPVTTSGTLALTLTSGYVIPLSASTTEWTNFYNTPSTRITDGTGLTWSANTLNVDDVYVLNTGDSISGNLTFSGTTANIALGSNWLSGDGGDEGIYVDSSGNVGIGTTTIGARLSLQTTGTTDILNLFETGGTEVFSVLESGNIGIGTSTPAAKLDLTGTAGSGNIFTISSSTNSRLLTLNALGYLGIGSSTPSAPLVVDDGVNATSTVQIGGPGSVGCLAIRDTDDAGYTYVTALNGVLSASMTSCE